MDTTLDTLFSPSVQTDITLSFHMSHVLTKYEEIRMRNPFQAQICISSHCDFSNLFI